ncbi:hypothetical protein [Glaciihabitans sp. UYNi722]|uniref:hypothetical protein n=1 Tax=Glaciihabitans sp. UYNi722 TaxID=3156344 RepID=UPI0033939745
MENLATTNGIFLTSDLRAFGLDGSIFRKAAARRQLVRLHRGAFMDAADFAQLGRNEKYRQRVIGALMASRGDPVASHASAAALWRLPIIGGWPEVVHVLAPKSTGTRTENGFTRHARGFDDTIVRIDGVRVTSLHQTLLDVAATATFASAVTSIDSALGHELVTGESLLSSFDASAMTRYRRRTLRALEFGTPLSGSAGESLSRANIHELGFPAPVLQASFRDARGYIGDTDFWRPEHNRIGEFDGFVKYTRAEYTGGRPIEEVVFAEKVREDRLRATGPSVSRWLWDTALHPKQLYDLLYEAGLRSSRRGA